MSSSYVRAKIRQWCAEVATSESVPFHDTVNITQKPSDKLWFTVEFVTEYKEGTFCDRGYLEKGFIKVVIFARPGTGDIAAIDAMEKIAPALFAKVDPTNKLILEQYDGIEDFSGGSADNHYNVAVNFDYTHHV